MAPITWNDAGLLGLLRNASKLDDLMFLELPKVLAVRVMCVSGEHDKSGEEQLSKEARAVRIPVAKVLAGDLFSFSQGLGLPGPAREAIVMQILPKLLKEVMALHIRGRAHGNLCMENILVHCTGECTGELEVELVDPFQSDKPESQDKRRPMYTPPEAYDEAEQLHRYIYPNHGLREADLFACGVVAYSLAIGEYPFINTAPGGDRAFEYLREEGPMALLARRKCGVGRPGPKARVVDCMSEKFARGISLLLSTDPSERKGALAYLSR